MRIERIEVEGHRDLGKVDWRPADLTVLRGDGASALAEAVFTLSQVPRGWADLAEYYTALALPPRATEPGGEAHTTRWRLTCSPLPWSDDRRTAEYELGIYPATESLPWEIHYEYLSRFDDFDSVELLRREGSGAQYELSASKRAGAKARRKGRESFAGDISVLGARAELYEDPAVRPFAEALATWSWYRGFDLEAARAERLFPGYHGRLWERGGNLTQALMSLCDDARTRDAANAAATLACGEHRGFGFASEDDGGAVTLVQRTATGELRAGALPDGFVTAMCAASALLATSPPALMWFEPEALAGCEPLAPALAEAIRGLAGRAQLVLRDPPVWLLDALNRAGGGSPLSVQRVTVELGATDRALTVEEP